MIINNNNHKNDGYLSIDGTKLMFHMDRISQWTQGENIFPLHLDIAPSGACNHRCIFCVADYKQERDKILDIQVLKRLLRDAAKYGVKSILFAGDGEPLLNKDLPDAVKEGFSQGLSLALNTNGVLFKDNKAKSILPYLEWIRFSVNASKKENYARIHRADERDFNTVLANISNASELKRKNDLKVTLGVQQILVQENINDVYELALKVKEVGADYFIVKRFAQNNSNDYKVKEKIYQNCIDDFKRAEELSDERFQVIIRWKNFHDNGERAYQRCLGLPFLAYVLADGGIYTCCNFYGNSAFCYGNLYKNTFYEIWTSKIKKLISSRIEKQLNVHKCMSFCRHHNINKLLWDLKNPPMHLNFI